MSEVEYDKRLHALQLAIQAGWRASPQDVMDWLHPSKEMITQKPVRREHQRGDWTPERLALLDEIYPKDMTLKVVWARVNELPGKPVSFNAIWFKARKRGLKSGATVNAVKVAAMNMARAAKRLNSATEQ